MRILVTLVWVLFALSSGLVSGQERDSIQLEIPGMMDIKDSLSIILSRDTLQIENDDFSKYTHDLAPGETIYTPQTGNLPPLDSIPSLPDSLRRRVVVGLTDPLDTIPNQLFAYQVLSRNSYARIQLPIDTTLRCFDINNPIFRKYPVGSYLGNAGSSYYSLGFEGRKRPSDFLFLDHVADYLHDPEETIYYQTQFPHTLIDYSSAGPKIENESIFKLVHTQNVNKDLNVGMYYDIISSAGQYVNQNTSTNGFSLFSAYRGTQYSMYTNFNWNNVRMRENGGIADMEKFSSAEKPFDNTVRSGVGKTILLNRSFYLMHSYSPRRLILGRNNSSIDSIDVSRFTLMQTIRYEWNKREYSDTISYPLQGKTPYFGVLYGKNTHDSLYFRRMENHFELLIKEQSRRTITAGLGVGLLTEFDRYNNHKIPDTIPNPISSNGHPGWGGDLPLVSGLERDVRYRETVKHINTAITGRFFNHTGRYLNWDFNGRLYFTGYKVGDLNINGTVQIHYYTAKGRNSLLLGGSLENAHPSYFLNQYASNLLAWDNKFNSSQEARLRGEFIMPSQNLKLGAYISQLNNYVYINKNAEPEQTSEALVIGTAYVEKDIRWWKLGFRFRLYGQYSSHEKIIPLPAFAGFQSTYFEAWLVKKVLTMQLGWNLMYNTPYYAYAYMPVTGMFYLQDEQKIGNYPFFDFFLNFQINRARIFVKTDGLNTFFKNYLGKENFMTYRFPTNDLRVKFGISWAFYD